jgi:hypothetical protein
MLFQITPLARPTHRFVGRWSPALDRIRIREGFRPGILVDRTAGLAPRETYEQDPLRQACDIIVES